MSDTPRTNDIQYGIEKRSHLRGFVVPDDVFDMMELARQLERELAAKSEECERLRKDAERPDWFENRAAEGGCPSLINDDNGHWTVADAIQFGDMAILTVAKAAADSYRSDYPKDPK